ncbi:MAG: metallophosphoesterase [Candidatus Peribacteraceae bacterium]|nr:metallophosphoesterase [Candidatus Peribacteraceae bacterium]
MSEIFVVSDTHLGHSNILKFSRSEFNTIEDHDETLIDLHNSVVGKRDIVIHVGDAVWKMENLKKIGRMNGKKRLILGNHDRLNAHEYLKYFISVHGSLQKHEFLFSHIPIIMDGTRHYSYNVHGHIHDESQNIDDWKYFNANIDVMGYVPISLDEIRSLMYRRMWCNENDEDWRKA